MGRRRPALAAVSAVVIFGSVALFAHLYASASHETAVLVATRTVQQGQLLTTADLGQTSAAIGPGIVSVPVSRVGLVLGKYATATVPAGSLLAPADVASSPPIPAGDAVVGLALKQGQLPAGGVASGDQVMVIETGPPNSTVNSFVGGNGSAQTVPASSTGDPASGATASPANTPSAPTGVLVPDAVVYGSDTPGPQSSSDAAELVSLDVAASVAPAVSSTAAAGQVSLALVPVIAGPPANSSSSSRPHPSGRRVKQTGSGQRRS